MRPLSCLWLLPLLFLTFYRPVEAQAGFNPSVAAYVVDRLSDLGCDKMFGVPGDFAFPINNAVAASKRMKWIATANELNAGYSADGYARVKGVGCYSDTYGVGELSSINSMMGSKAEMVPVFHVVGCPSTRLLDQRRVLHHTLGKGGDDFFDLSCAPAVACTRLTALNAIDEMERVITAALTLRGPVYIQIPTDVAEQAVIGKPIKGLPFNKLQLIKSEPTELKAAVASILKRLRASKTPVILPSIHISRLQLNKDVLAVVDATGIPFATTGVDKGVLPETHPKFLGMYQGNDSFPPALTNRVEDSDLVLNLGDSTFTDIVVGHGSVQIPKDNMIVVGPSYVRVYQGAGDVDARSMLYAPVWIGDVLAALKASGKHPVANTPNGKAPPLPPGAAESIKEQRAQLKNASAPITYDTFTRAIEDVLQPSDIVVADCGSMPAAMGKAKLPANVSFNGQFVWGSIGWGTPAAEGFKAASPGSRVFLMTGDGAHHMTLNELGFMCMHDINPIIVVANNGWYQAEEELLKNDKKIYNKIPGGSDYKFAALPGAMGCKKWFVTQVDNPPAFVNALKKAAASGGGAYIEARMLGPPPPPVPQTIVDQFYLTKPLDSWTVVL